jgi:hypothetical protein
MLTLVKVHEPSKEIQNILIDEGEIALVKKASRAFAVSYVNEIYNTIKSTDSTAMNNLTFIHNYPSYLYLFIHQEEPGEIKQLDIYSEKKNNQDGVSEVKEIYHEAECDTALIRKKKRILSKKCSHWRWKDLEIPKMYTMALTEGKKVGTSIYSRYVLSFNWLYPKSFVHQPNMSFPGHKIEGFEGHRH